MATGGTSGSSGGAAVGGVGAAGGPLGGAGASGGSVGVGTGGSAASGGAASGGAAGDGSTGDAGGAAGTGGSSGGVSGAGSGGASGGSGGASGSGAGGSSAIVNCPAGAVFCDDFESYPAMMPPTGKWKVTTVGNATATIDAAHAFSGSKAAHFHNPMAAEGAYALMLAAEAPTFPIAGNKFYVRFMLYIDRWPTSADHTRLMWMGTKQALTNVSRGIDGSGYLFCNYNGVAIERLASGYYRNTATQLTDATRRGKWACFEMAIDNNGGPPTGGVGAALPQIWEDDKPYTLALAGDKGVAYNGIAFEALQFSMWSPHVDTAAADYWIDDVAISNQPIHCPAKN